MNQVKQPIEAIFFDMDDTLIPSGHFYFKPDLDCALLIVSELGRLSPDPATMIQSADQIRKDLMNQPGENSPTVFAEAWVAYYKNICEIINREPNQNMISALFVSAMKWVQEKYTMYDGLEEFLKSLTWARKIVTTLGQKDIQEYKAQSAGITPLVEAVEVMNLKNVESFAALLQKYSLDPSTTVIVGDNPKLDIIPCVILGMRAFHVVGPHEKTIFEKYPKTSFNTNNIKVIKSAKEILEYL